MFGLVLAFVDLHCFHTCSCFFFFRQLGRLGQPCCVWPLSATVQPAGIHFMGHVCACKQFDSWLSVYKPLRKTKSNETGRRVKCVQVCSNGGELTSFFFFSNFLNKQSREYHLSQAHVRAHAHSVRRLWLPAHVGVVSGSPLLTCGRLVNHLWHNLTYKCRHVFAPQI